MHWFLRLFAPSPTLQEYNALRNEVGLLRKEVRELKNVAESKIRIYRCIICNRDFTRLPSESDKRCPACMQQIREASGLGQNNRAHRPDGHNTRGVHKRAGEVGR